MQIVPQTLSNAICEIPFIFDLCTNMCKYSFLTHQQVRFRICDDSKAIKGGGSECNVSQLTKYLLLFYEIKIPNWTRTPLTVDHRECSHQILIWGFKRPSH